MNLYKETVKADLKNNTENVRAKLFLKILRKQQQLLAKKKIGVSFLFLKIVHFFVFDKYCVDIDEHTNIGAGLRLPHLQGIIIAKNAIIGTGCTIFHHVTIGVNEHKDASAAPQIGNNVYIGAGAKVIGDISIGDCVTIGANAVVTHDIPENSTVVGINHIIKREETK